VAGPALEGTLVDLPLDLLLGFLAVGRHTGTISFGGEHAATLSLRDGRVTLGLLDEGPSRDDLEAPAPGDTERREASAHDHLLTVLARLLIERDVPFTFIPGEPHDLGTAVSEPTEDLLASAETRAVAWVDLRRTVPSDDLVLRLRRRLPAEAPTVTLTADEWALATTVDGRTGLIGLARRAEQSLFTTVRAAARLLELGAAEPVSEPGARDPKPDTRTR
jgi:hypothetical protein